MSWLTKKRNVQSVPLIVWILSIIFYILPLFIDNLSGKYEWMWLISLVPSFLFAYYHGLKGAVITAIIYSLIHGIFEYYQIKTVGEIYETTNANALITTFILGFSFAIGIGILSDKLHRNQRRLEEANKVLSQLSMLDGLTEIGNRRCFDKHLSQEWGRGLRYRTPLSLFMIDIDFFKGFNDKYGHQGGDDCLKQVATILNENVNRSCDVVARYGGEEFAVILPDTDEKGALILAENLRSRVERLYIPRMQSEVNQCLTISVGIATMIPNAISKPQDLIARADEALYQAKQQGRNKVVQYK